MVLEDKFLAKCYGFGALEGCLICITRLLNVWDRGAWQDQSTGKEVELGYACKFIYPGSITVIQQASCKKPEVFEKLVPLVGRIVALVLKFGEYQGKPFCSVLDVGIFSDSDSDLDLGFEPKSEIPEVPF